MSQCNYRFITVTKFFYAVLCQDGDVRLVGSKVPYEGRVEMCFHETWSAVCDKEWTNFDAQVICKQLRQTSAGNVECISVDYNTRKRMRRREGVGGRKEGGI